MLSNHSSIVVRSIVSAAINALIPAIVLLSCATVAFASGPPQIEIVGGESIDLGRGIPGRYEREIAITNTGGDTLHLFALSSGCGCLVGEPDKRALAPGDTAHVVITVETGGQVVEKWQKALAIVSNDPKRRVLDVIVRISFLRDLRLRTLINTVRHETCDSACAWLIEIENISDSIVVINPPFVEEMRGLSVVFDLTKPRDVAPGEILVISGRITILGDEPIPSAKAVITSSSQFDRETNVAYFYAPDSSR